MIACQSSSKFKNECHYRIRIQVLKFKFKMSSVIRWTEDWLQPPSSLEQVELWKLYLVIWKDAHLTPPGTIVRNWLQQHGLPAKENDPKGHFKAALSSFAFQDNKLRKAAS